MRLSRLIFAVDCGSVADPRSMRLQVEAGIVSGLAFALGDGAGALHREAPVIEIHFTDGAGAPEDITGSTAAAIAPAVANAIFNAAGRRIRTLPIVATPKEVS